MARKEKDFQTDLRHSLSTLPGEKHFYKIPDEGISSKPYDCYMLYKDKFTAMELKICKNLTSIPLWNHFKGRGHQLRHLMRVKRCGGQALILINVFNPRKWNYMYVFDIVEYMELMQDILPKKSIKLDDPRLDKFIRIDKQNGIYDLQRIV